MSSLYLEKAITRALNCNVNDFAGIPNAQCLEYNAYLGLVSALAPYYRYHNYRKRIDSILYKFSDTHGMRLSNDDKILKEMADEIISLLNDIELDSTIG